jgi:hypothetical protein
VGLQNESAHLAGQLEDSGLFVHGVPMLIGAVSAVEAGAFAQVKRATLQPQTFTGQLDGSPRKSVLVAAAFQRLHDAGDDAQAFGQAGYVWLWAAAVLGATQPLSKGGQIRQQLYPPGILRKMRSGAAYSTQ